MDIIQFFGRFHVLVLHLPIGILMLAALLELAISVNKKERNTLLNVIWFWGAVSAIAACVLGFLLSLADGYSADAIFIHRTFGIATAVLAVFAYLYTRFIIKHNKVLIWAICTVQLLLLFSTGHYGANMTHGETYLVDKAPNFVRQALGFAAHLPPREKPTSLEDADVYLDLIQPMLQKRCMSCHNDQKQKGKLNLASYETLMQGGKTGKAVIPSDLHHSELYTRITLDHDEKGFMPAEGKTPFTQMQTQAFKWWIANGALSTGKLSELVKTKQDTKLITSVLGIKDESTLPGIAPITDKQATALFQAGFVIKQVSKNNNYLSLDLSIKKRPLDHGAIQALLSVSSHVVSLNLRHSNISDSQLAELTQLPNLQRLRLEGNPISTLGVKHLVALDKLSYLNLYKTDVDDDLLKTLNEFSSLTQVYVGETNMSLAAIEDFNRQSDLHLVGVRAVTPSQPNKQKQEG